MSHIQIDDSQDHKDKRLQQHYQDMEDCPAQLQQAAKSAQSEICTVHNGNQDKNHFARIEISKQSQRMRDRFGNQIDKLKQEIYRYK